MLESNQLTTSQCCVRITVVRNDAKMAYDGNFATLAASGGEGGWRTGNGAAVASTDSKQRLKFTLIGCDA